MATISQGKPAASTWPEVATLSGGDRYPTSYEIVMIQKRKARCLIFGFHRVRAKAYLMENVAGMESKMICC
jgi:hypothetical protein